ncbi:TOG array regulator of axonemal microtubules protein 1-like [Trichomycterus rosablanca]|uniref:TOG array regulator of axonemal microtubules protein 1-like n=1 Tax=Trichomycterus rosablanca TaxID=2290929 RepID=UPI002F350819
MDLQELIEEYYGLLERAAEIRWEISSRIGSSATDDRRMHPQRKSIVLDAATLNQMETELQKYLESRSCALTETAEAFNRTQEAIIRRICGPSEVKAMQDYTKAEAQKAAWNVKAMGSRALEPESMCSPVDMCTPSELRALSHLFTPVPPSTPAVTKTRFRRSLIPRLPVLCLPTKGEPRVNDPQVDSVTRTEPAPFPKRNDPPLKPTVSQRRPVAQNAAVVHQKKRQEPQVKAREVAAENRRTKKENLVLSGEKPLDRPEAALDQAFQLLELEDWNRKVDGLKVVRALAEHHAGILLPRLHDVCLAVVKEVANLRSMVARAAMTTVAHLFAHLQRAMDHETEAATEVLLHKAGESSQFIKDDVDAALTAMVHCCSPTRVMNALLDGGLSHRNAAVRRCAAMHLDELAQVVGASRLLSAKTPLSEHFLSGVCRLALDSSQEVRFHARSTLRLLGPHKDLMKMVDKFIPTKDKAAIKDIITKAR